MKYLVTLLRSPNEPMPPLTKKATWQLIHATTPRAAALFAVGDESRRSWVRIPWSEDGSFMAYVHAAGGPCHDSHVPLCVHGFKFQRDNVAVWRPQGAKEQSCLMF